MSELLHFSEHRLQEVALTFMGTVYCLRLLWLFTRFKAGKERQPPRFPGGAGTNRGILCSWAMIAMPWAMESYRKRLFLWIQFALFHLAVAAAITLSFVIPYGPGLLERHPWLTTLFQVPIAAGFLMGVVRLVRRIGSRYMRAISSPDDYFSIVLLVVWLAFGFLAAPNDYKGSEFPLLAFFILTAFFLVYVPFSKISHYLYYPFTRYYLGKSFGRRGVYPLRTGPKVGQV